MDKVVAPAKQNLAAAQTAARLIDARSWRFRVQEMRLIAALVEAGWAVVVNDTQLCALEPTQQFYPYQITSRENAAEAVDLEVVVDHSKPWIQIGQLGNPLFFPEWLAAVGQAKGLKRDILISFSGNLPTERLIACLRIVQIYAWLRCA
ncbi:MAG: hypothetical protein ACFB5Z_15460 [Elainellaceae cyanobacterium]